VRDQLVYASGQGLTIFEDVATGTTAELKDLPWPARFDASGRYLYTPSYGSAPRGQPLTSTTIFDVQNRRVAATLPGVPPYQNLYLDFVPVTGTLGGFAAALQGAPGCDGTALYADSRLVKCIVGGVGPSFSPNGRWLALARRTGGDVDYGRAIYDILLVDAATGAERVLASGAVGHNPYPLPSLWNATSTHLLVCWPFAYGP
jgi:hypothetical protein